MKKATIVISTLFILISIPFLIKSLKQAKKHPSQFKLIVKFDKNIVKVNKLVITPEELKPRLLKEFLKKNKVREIQAVFRNRYDRDGKKKFEIKSNDLELYRQIIIGDKPKALALVNQLNHFSGVAQAYIEEPFHIKPSFTPNDVNYISQ